MDEGERERKKEKERESEERDPRTHTARVSILQNKWTFIQFIKFDFAMFQISSLPSRFSPFPGVVFLCLAFSPQTSTNINYIILWDNRGIADG